MAEKVNLDNAVDWNDYGVSVEGQPQVKIRGGQETPEWFDYEAYRKSQGKEGDWSAPEMKNPDTLTKIRSALARVKEAPEVLGYAAHKVADPMYANVDYMGQQVGDWASKKINNVARAFDVSPEARQYGRFEEEEYDPEAVDVRFGRNAYKEGYDNLGDYLEAKDQEKVDRYRGYNHANRFAPIENADDKFYTLSDTQTMEDWQPETTSGKIAKGAIETAGNMLPENLKALMEEKGIEGGAKMLGALAPMYKRIVSQREEVNRLREAAKAETNPARKAKLETTANKYERQYFRDKRDLEEATLNQRYAKKVVKPEEYNKAKATLSTEEFDTYTKDIGRGEYSNGSLRGKFAPTHKKLEDYENQSLAKMMRERAARGENPIPEYAVDDLGEYTGDYAKYFESGLEPAEKKAIVRNIRKGEPKPLPNPAAQRAEALRRNLVEDYRTMKGNATNGTPLIPEETYYGSPKQDPAVLKSMARNVEKEARQKYLVNKPTAKPVFDTGYGDIYQARNVEEAKMINALNNVKKEYPHLEWQYDPETSDAVGKFVVQVAEPEGGFARVIEFNDTQDFLDFMKDADRYGQLP